MSGDDEDIERRRVKDVHRALGMWSIRRALTVAFSSAAVGLVAAWLLVTWLLGSPHRAQPTQLDITAQLELFKLVFALVAGIGVLVALVTAYRRQRIDEAAGERAERIQAHAERVARDAAHDATERRITDLYGQAIEQLGHDKAAVRLGGLYSLERLAQDHPQYRQTVTDVVCADLRMPFQLPPPPTQPAHHQPVPPDTAPPNATPGANADTARQELQVRLTAQRLLRRHLTTTPPNQDHPATYWDGIDLDLTSALLHQFDFSQCRPAQATFTNAQFSGDAWFEGAQFSGDAWFDGAQFSETARFHGAQFSGDARFREAQFSGDAWFHQAKFNETATFHQAQFNGDAGFHEAQFSGTAWFQRAEFSGTAGFHQAQFNGDARFHQSKFRGKAWFHQAQFGGDTWFDEAQLGEEAWFRKARFSGTAKFDRAQFGAPFKNTPDFTDATARYPNDAHVWPFPWRGHAESDETEMARLVQRQ